jgi:hypothetical protein
MWFNKVWSYEIKDFSSLQSQLVCEILRPLCFSILKFVCGIYLLLSVHRDDIPRSDGHLYEDDCPLLLPRSVVRTDRLSWGTKCLHSLTIKALFICKSPVSFYGITTRNILEDRKIC